jgi:hypothetical protein
VADLAWLPRFWRNRVRCPRAVCRPPSTPRHPRLGGDLGGGGGDTGDVALFADSTEAFADAERIVGIATIVLIVSLQLLIFRRPGPGSCCDDAADHDLRFVTPEPWPAPAGRSVQEPRQGLRDHSGSSSQG